VRFEIAWAYCESDETRNLTAHVDAKVSHVMWSRLKSDQNETAAGTKGGDDLIMIGCALCRQVLYITTYTHQKACFNPSCVLLQRHNICFHAQLIKIYCQHATCKLSSVHGEYSTNAFAGSRLYGLEDSTVQDGRPADETPVL
jgi:hypothetical protein